MAYDIEKVDVWHGAIQDRPGGLADVVEPLAEAGANLEFVFARQDSKGKGLIFVSPLKGAAVIRAAKRLRLSRNAKLAYIRIKGLDQKGLGARITRALGDAGINMVGLAAGAHSGKSMCYLEFAKADAAKARRVLAKALNG